MLLFFFKLTFFCNIGKSLTWGTAFVEAKWLAKVWVNADMTYSYVYTAGSWPLVACSAPIKRQYSFAIHADIWRTMRASLFVVLGLFYPKMMTTDQHHYMLLFSVCVCVLFFLLCFIFYSFTLFCCFLQFYTAPVIFPILCILFFTHSRMQ